MLSQSSHCKNCKNRIQDTVTKHFSLQKIDLERPEADRDMQKNL